MKNRFLNSPRFSIIWTTEWNKSFPGDSSAAAPSLSISLSCDSELVEWEKNGDDDYSFVTGYGMDIGRRCGLSGIRGAYERIKGAYYKILGFIFT